MLDSSSSASLSLLESQVKEKDQTIARMSEELKQREAASRLVNKNGGQLSESKYAELTAKVADSEK